jgi:hypothetical protein
MNWFDPLWTKRIKITVNKDQVGGADQTDFPVYVNLDDLPDAFFAGVLSTGADIRITTSDEVTECPFEIVFIDTNAKTGELHFKAPSLSHSVDTDFYIYYGNAAAVAYAVGDPYGRNNVWTCYSGVWHLHETSGSVTDSTSGGKNLAFKGDLPDVARAGQLSGNAQDLDGVGDYMDNAAAFAPSDGSFSVSIWFYPDTTDGNQGLFTDRSGVGTKPFWEMGFERVSHKFTMLLGTEGDGEDWYTPSATSGPGAWYHVVFVKLSGIGCYLFINGTKYTFANNTRDLDTIGPLRIGRIYNADAYYSNGIVDEARVALGTALPDAWVTCEYNNQLSPSTFYGVGPEESPTPTAPGISPFLPFKGSPTGYNCFVQQYVKNLILGVAPFKLPSLTRW